MCVMCACVCECVCACACVCVCVCEKERDRERHQHPDPSENSGTSPVHRHFYLPLLSMRVIVQHTATHCNRCIGLHLSRRWLLSLMPALVPCPRLFSALVACVCVHGVCGCVHCIACVGACVCVCVCVRESAYVVLGCLRVCVCVCV